MKHLQEPELPEQEIPELPEQEIPEQIKENPDTPILNFMNTKQKTTADSYRSGLFDFFDFIMKKKIRKRIEGKKEIDVDFKIYFSQYEKIALKYITSDRNHAQDLIGYAKHLTVEGKNPKTAHGRIAGIKEFYAKYRLTLNEEEQKNLRKSQPKMRVSTDFTYIDKKILGEVLHHGDARFRAFILTAASSGARLGEVLNLNWSDIEVPDRRAYPDKPASIRIRVSKTGAARTVYFTRECEAALAEWRKVYAGYRSYATKRSLNLRDANKEKQNGDERVFPFTKTSVYRLWDRALESAGYLKRDIETNRNRMNIHRLRNFFSVQVSSAAGESVAEVLLGHVDRYGGAYKGRSDENWEKEYLKAEPSLTISVIEDPVQKVEVAALKITNAAMQDEMNGLKNDIAILRETLALEKGASICVTMPKGIPANKAIELNKQISALNTLLKQWSE